MTKPHPQNVKRAAWAREALDRFVSLTTSDEKAELLHPEDRADAVSDLVCDLLHYCAHTGLDGGELVGRGQRNYEHEAQPGYQGD